MTKPSPGGAWHYEPNRDYVAGLAEVFRLGNAPQLAGMLLSLADPGYGHGRLTPCYLDVPALAVFAPNDGEYSSNVVESTIQLGGIDYYSILQGSARSDPLPDLSVEQFFYHADVLSGQDVGKVRAHVGTKLDRLDLLDGGFVERAIAALDATRTGGATSIWTDLFDMFIAGTGGLWEHWTSPTANDARDKFDHVRKWFAKEASDGVFRQEALRHLSEVLIKYAAVIHGARMNLDNLMGELVDRVHEWNEKTPADTKPGSWVSLADVRDWTTSVSLGSAFKVIDMIGAAASSLIPEKQLPEDQIYHKFTAYLDAADRIVRDAVGEIDALVRELDGVRKNRHDPGVDIPVWSE